MQDTELGREQGDLLCC